MTPLGADYDLQRILALFDELIIRCTLAPLPEVVKRIEPIRDMIAKGIELRRLVQDAEKSE